MKKTIEFTPEEMAEIIGCLSNSASSMESESEKQKAISLAKTLVGKCKENGIAVSAYEEEEYLGKTYHLKPDDKHYYGYWHEWTADDPCYSTVEYTKYDKLCIEDKASHDEIKLELLKSLRLEFNDKGIYIIVSRKLGDKTYSYKLAYGNGCKILGPFDEFDNEVETDHHRIYSFAVDDIFKLFMHSLDCMQCVEHEIRPLVHNVAENEIIKLSERIEKENRRNFQNKLNSFLMSNGTIRLNYTN